MPDPLSAASLLIENAITRQIFPAAVAEAGDSRRALWTGAFGRLTFEQNAASTTQRTIFDLASLTKPIVAATLAVEMVRAGTLRLDEPVAASVPEWRGKDRDAVTVRDLLEHASGLPARLVDPPPATRREFEHDICTIKLEYAPRATSVYSDLGFILLGLLLEKRAGRDLRQQFDEQRRAGGISDGDPLGDRLDFATLDQRETYDTAPTRPLDEDVRRGRVLQGEVHDNYAAALGGAAGHAGLFGNAPAVGRFARAMLCGARGDAGMSGPFAPAAVALATEKSTVAGSSRALGWDTMRPTSSCGSMLSPAAFGHTGFTGTSVWIDPVLDRYFVLLTNRAYGNGTLEQMRDVRRAFHDTIAAIDG